MPFWKTHSFKALQAEWYARLKAYGFEDAEEIVGDEMKLKQTAEHVYRGLEELQITNKEAYYAFVSQKVQETVFQSDVDRLILLRHAEGRRIKHICEELVDMGKGRCRETIRFKIRIYQMKWGIRKFTPKQLNRRVS